MKKASRCLLLAGTCMITACLCSSGNAQYIRSRLVQRQYVPHVASVPQTPMLTHPQLGDCGCGIKPHCDSNICDLKIYGKGVCYSKSSTPIHVNPPTDCECFSENIPFYYDEQEREGTTVVPASVKSCIEEFKFTKRTFEICGCKLEVCIPCAIEVCKKEECKPREKRVKMVARVRTSSKGSANPRADIWVFNIQGLPDKAVLALNVDSDTANRKFNASFDY